MKHVLLIGNIDDQSIPILRYSAKLCRYFDLKLHLLQIEEGESTVLSSPYYYNKLGFKFKTSDSSKKKELESFVHNNVNNIIDSSWVSTKLETGNIEQCLAKFLNEEKIDLIIGRQAIFKNFNLKNNNIFKQILLNISKLPVLLIPENYSFEPIQKFAFPVTFKQDNYNNVEWIINNIKNSKIDILSFSNSVDKTKEEQRWIKYLTSELGEENIKYKYQNMSIEYFMDKEAENNFPDYDCLVLTTHKRTFWEKLLDPSTTLEFLNQTETPVLVFKYSADKLSIF